MGLGSILLGVFSLVCMFGGVVLTIVPFLGTMLSFLSPVLALAGIVLGGVAMSRARESGDSDGLAIAGLVVNVVAFVPAMLVALTCGLCNTLCTGAMLTPRDPNAPQFWMQDGGGAPTPFDLLFMDGGTAAPGVGPAPAFPPPAFPPPPLDPSAPVDPNAPLDPSAPVDPNAPVDPSAVDPSGPTNPSAIPPPPLPAGPTHRGAHAGGR